MGRLLYHGENLNSVPNDANLVKMNDGTNVEDSIESVKNALSNIVSDAYSSTKAYAVGDLVIYNNSLWKCKVSCKGQTPSENTYWTKTSVSSEIQEELLYTGTSQVDSITLSKGISNYSKIRVEGICGGLSVSNTNTVSDISYITIGISTSATLYLYYQKTSDTTFAKTGSNSAIYISRIYGIGKKL